MKILRRFRTRFFAYAVLLLFVMAAADLVADRVFVDRWVEHELEGRRARVNIPITVYGAGGELLASSIEPPVAPPPDDVLTELASGSQPITRHNVVMTGMFRDGVFSGVVARRIPPPFEPYPGPPAALVVLAVAVCMATALLASIPLSRSIVRPVEALARSVRRFGAGELGVRADVVRGDETGDLASAFNDMATRIESLVRSEQHLIADVSHELRTPLARIRVVLELASDGDPEHVRRYLGEIAHDLAELEDLVEDVLTTARLDLTSDRLGEVKALPMRWTTARLGDIVDKSRVRFEKLHPEQSLDAAIGHALPDIDCDPHLLRRALDNLLDNAATHGKGGRVHLRVSADAEQATLEVADDGPGMTPEAVARAFEPFFRDDASRDRRTGGVGLGLSIVRSIVEAHGGHVALESSPGRGTKVTVRLPLER